MTITPVYAALATILFVYLSFRVIGMRKSDRISLGDGDSGQMRKRIRVHANFAEYAPLALLVMLMAEMQSAAPWTLHLIGGTLLIGRILHAYAVSHSPQVMNLRVAGMVLTFVSLISGAIANLAIALM